MSRKTQDVYQPHQLREVSTINLRRALKQYPMPFPRNAPMAPQTIQAELDRRSEGSKDFWRIVLPIITAVAGWAVGHFWK